MMTGSSCAPLLTVPSRVARTAAMARTSILRAGQVRALDRTVGNAFDDCLQPVVALVVKMIGLGRGDQYAVDAVREQVGQEAAPADSEAG